MMTVRMVIELEDLGSHFFIGFTSARTNVIFAPQNLPQAKKFIKIYYQIKHNM